MFNLSPSRKKFFKIDFETGEETELTNVSERNNGLFMSKQPIVHYKDSIKIIDVDGYEEIRKVRDSNKELYRQKVTFV